MGMDSGIYAFSIVPGFANRDESFRVVLDTMICFRDLFRRLGLFIMHLHGFFEALIVL